MEAKSNLQHNLYDHKLTKVSEAYLKPSQTSMIELFARIVDD